MTDRSTQARPIRAVTFNRRVALGVALASLVSAGWAQDALPRWAMQWPETDFGRAAVPLHEILSGGVPRDGIPAISNPEMMAAGDETRLAEREPVMTVEIAGAVPRAYPLRYLTWHEIVNDEIGGMPLAITFCPLCNSGLVFDRRVDGRVLEFGVSGMLRHSDMIMYDRQTFSWWQQFTGEAIVGELTGNRLDVVASWMEPWADFLERNPRGLVMAEPSGHRRPYGQNPYVGYDTGQPFLYRGENPPHGIEPLARVLRVGNRAWPLERLAEAGELTEAGLYITWRTGMTSALDTASMAEGRDVGSIRVRNAATGADVPHEVVFAFAFHAFEPRGIWMLGN